MVPALASLSRAAGRWLRFVLGQILSSMSVWFWLVARDAARCARGGTGFHAAGTRLLMLPIQQIRMSTHARGHALLRQLGVTPVADRPG